MPLVRATPGPDAQRRVLPFRDATIVATATCRGAKTIMTEDPSNSPLHGPARVIHPFRPA
jgi:predicted nucleic acid-binding protein